MTYDEALSFWYGRINYEVRAAQPGDLKLERMRALLRRLGDPHEVPFTLAQGAPPLGPDAPGSAALRVGAPTSISPLERWLTLLFGPGR